MLVVIIARLRLQGTHLYSILDYIVIRALSQSAVIRATSQMLLQAHLFIIRGKKSSLIPSTRITHLGAEIDTSVEKNYPSVERFQKIQVFIILLQLQVSYYSSLLQTAQNV